MEIEIKCQTINIAVCDNTHTYTQTRTPTYTDKDTQTLTGLHTYILYAHKNTNSLLLAGHLIEMKDEYTCKHATYTHIHCFLLYKYLSRKLISFPRK